MLLCHPYSVTILLYVPVSVKQYPCGNMFLFQPYSAFIMLHGTVSAILDNHSALCGCFSHTRHPSSYMWLFQSQSVSILLRVAILAVLIIQFTTVSATLLTILLYVTVSALFGLATLSISPATLCLFQSHHTRCPLF
jgi:hypothetical protein